MLRQLLGVGNIRDKMTGGGTQLKPTPAGTATTGGGDVDDPHTIRPDQWNLARRDPASLIE